MWTIAFRVLFLRKSNSGFFLNQYNKNIPLAWSCLFSFLFLQHRFFNSVVHVFLFLFIFLLYFSITSARSPIFTIHASATLIFCPSLYFPSFLNQLSIQHYRFSHSQTSFFFISFPSQATNPAKHINIFFLPYNTVFLSSSSSTIPIFAFLSSSGP